MAAVEPQEAPKGRWAAKGCEGSPSSPVRADGDPVRFALRGAAGVVYDEAVGLLLVLAQGKVFTWPMSPRLSAKKGRASHEPSCCSAAARSAPGTAPTCMPAELCSRAACGPDDGAGGVRATPSATPGGDPPGPPQACIAMTPGPVLGLRFSLDGRLLSLQRSASSIDVLLLLPVTAAAAAAAAGAGDSSCGRVLTGLWGGQSPPTVAAVAAATVGGSLGTSPPEGRGWGYDVERKEGGKAGLGGGSCGREGNDAEEKKAEGKAATGYPTTVELVAVRVTTHTHKCKSTSDRILGFFWSDCVVGNFVVVTTRGLSICQVTTVSPAKVAAVAAAGAAVPARVLESLVQLRVVEVRRVSVGVAWCAYAPASRVLLLASGQHCGTLSCMQFCRTSIVDIPPFAAILSAPSSHAPLIDKLSTGSSIGCLQTNAAPAAAAAVGRSSGSCRTTPLTAQDVHSITLYGLVFCVQLDRAASVLHIFQCFRDAVSHSADVRVLSVSIAVSAIDNLLVVHHTDINRVLLLDPFSCPPFTPLLAPLPFIAPLCPALSSPWQTQSLSQTSSTAPPGAVDAKAAEAAEAAKVAEAAEAAKAGESAATQGAEHAAYTDIASGSPPPRSLLARLAQARVDSAQADLCIHETTVSNASAHHQREGVEEGTEGRSRAGSAVRLSAPLATGSSTPLEGRYPSSWVFLQPNLVLDRQWGRIWQLKLDLWAIARAVPCQCPSSLIAFLQRRRYTQDPTLIQKITLTALSALLQQQQPLQELEAAFDAVLLRFSAVAGAAAATSVAERAWTQDEPAGCTSPTPGGAPATATTTAAAAAAAVATQRRVGECGLRGPPLSESCPICAERGEEEEEETVVATEENAEREDEEWWEAFVDWNAATAHGTNSAHMSPCTLFTLLAAHASGLLASRRRRRRRRTRTRGDGEQSTQTTGKHSACSSSSSSGCSCSSHRMGRDITVVTNGDVTCSSGTSVGDSCHNTTADCCGIGGCSGANGVRLVCCLLRGVRGGEWADGVSWGELEARLSWLAAAVLLLMKSCVSLQQIVPQPAASLLLAGLLSSQPPPSSLVCHHHHEHHHDQKQQQQRMNMLLHLLHSKVLPDSLPLAMQLIHLRQDEQQPQGRCVAAIRREGLLMLSRLEKDVVDAAAAVGAAATAAAPHPHVEAAECTDNGSVGASASALGNVVTGTMLSWGCVLSSFRHALKWPLRPNHDVQLEGNLLSSLSTKANRFQCAAMARCLEDGALLPEHNLPLHALERSLS